MKGMVKGMIPSAKGTNGERRRGPTVAPKSIPQGVSLREAVTAPLWVVHPPYPANPSCHNARDREYKVITRVSWGRGCRC